MSKLIRTITPLSIIMLPICISACAGMQVDRKAVQASTDIPESAKVTEVTVNHEPSLPKYVVVFENFENATADSDLTSGTGAPTAPRATGSFQNIRATSPGHTMQISRTSSHLTDGTMDGTATSTRGPLSDAIARRVMEQFSTALGRWPNISIADGAVISTNGDGTLTTKLEDGEAGPFLIRGTVTEFSETSDLQGQNSSFSGGALGNVVSILAPTSQAGNLIAHVNPQVKNEKQTRKGVVAVDVKIIDARKGRQIAAFTCEGKFESQSAVSGIEILNSGGGKADYAASTIGQATRAAANDCLVKAAEALKRIPGKP